MSTTHSQLGVSGSEHNSFPAGGVRYAHHPMIYLATFHVAPPKKKRKKKKSTGKWVGKYSVLLITLFLPNNLVVRLYILIQKIILKKLFPFGVYPSIK